MANLTKEYFDKKIDGLDKGLKTYVDKKFDDLNARTANGFRDIQERLDVKTRVEKLERNYEKISKALNLTA